MSGRRRTDPNSSSDRRRVPETGAEPWFVTGIRLPSFQEQAIQFLTRYLFALLALVFFNLNREFSPIWLSAAQLNTALILYLCINSANFIHAWRRPVSPFRFRWALWEDIFMVALCVANDPNLIPPSMVAFIIVVLGNGMRYGVRFFAEAMFATLIGGVTAMAIRHAHLDMELGAGTLFLCLFGAIIVVYAFILMRRVEHSRHSSELVSRTDPLTGLLNRRGLTEAAEAWFVQRQGENRKPVVIFADLDNFKTVNDLHGHSEGDRVLVRIATILRTMLRNNDLVSRYGGDEFVILLADVELPQAQVIVERIQAGVDQWFHDNQLACGISIGFGVAPPNESNLGRLLQSVDRLLYQAKAQRNANGIRTHGIRPVELT